jgi:hypothetical protein
MKRYFQFAMLGAALLVWPGTAFSQDHRRYEDRGHRDSHEWNDREDEAYRRYLKERHREYRAFNRLSRKEQERYWEWRHREMHM